MVYLKDVILTVPIESHVARRIGILVIGPPFSIVYINEHARRIIGRVRTGAPGGPRGLPGAVMRFCREAGDLLAKIRARNERAARHLQLTVASAGTPLRLRAALIPPSHTELPSHVLIIIEEIHSQRVGLDHAVKKKSLCSADHRTKILS